MDLRTVSPLLLAVAFVCGCPPAEKDKNTDDDSADDAKDKKKKKGKKGEDSAAPASAAPTAKSTETAAATSTAATPTATLPPPAPPPAAGNPLATFFTGEPDPAIKFLKQKQIPNKPLWIQVVPYWKANTDDPPINEPWTDLSLEGKDKHATIWMWTTKSDATDWERMLSNNCSWSGSSGCKFDAPVDGTLGQGIKVKIAQGTAEKSKKPAKVWWMRGELKPGEDFGVFVSLRTDVWPKLEGEQLAMLKSVKIAGP